MFMSLLSGSVLLKNALVQLHWQPLADKVDAHPAGHLNEHARENGLTFVLTKTGLSTPDVLACHPCGPMPASAILRIDEVCFPVGAIAHRHTHAGAGIRHLVRGSLRLEADEHVQTLQTGESWFEAAHAPVRAVALQDVGVTSFLRAMIIPAKFEGKSTFTLADPDDANLPSLQMTHRHIDLPL